MIALHEFPAFGMSFPEELSFNRLL